MSEFSIDKGVHHLGDQEIDGWPPKLGRGWSKSFWLPDQPSDAILIIDVFSTEAEHNEVFINNQNVGHLMRNTKADYVPSAHPLRQGLLQKGTNNLYVRVGLKAVHPTEDTDDILIRNIRLVL